VDTYLPDHSIILGLSYQKKLKQIWKILYLNKANEVNFNTENYPHITLKRALCIVSSWKVKNMCASVVLPAPCLIFSQEVLVWLIQHACLSGESAAAE